MTWHVGRSTLVASSMLFSTHAWQTIHHLAHMELGFLPCPQKFNKRKHLQPCHRGQLTLLTQSLRASPSLHQRACNLNPSGKRCEMNVVYTSHVHSSGVLFAVFNAYLADTSPFSSHGAWYLPGPLEIQHAEVLAMQPSWPT